MQQNLTLGRFLLKTGGLHLTLKNFNAPNYKKIILPLDFNDDTYTEKLIWLVV